MSRLPLVVLGTGYVGTRLVARSVAEGRPTIATTRSPERAAPIALLGAEPLVLDAPLVALRAALAGPADLVVTFPPDGATDTLLARACLGARRIVYVSSTGVYGSCAGRVDEASPVDRTEARARMRLDAESAWRAAGAIVLRAPAIYGPWRGVHARLRDRKVRLVDDGTRRVSLLHVDDLVTFVLAALERAARDSTYVVGDLEPSPQREVVAWLCERLGLPLPGSVALADAPATLRADRAVAPTRALCDLGVTLAYPTFRDGFAAALAAEHAQAGAGR